MASIARPAMFRKTCLAAASKSTFSTANHSIKIPIASTISRPTGRIAFTKKIVPTSARIAAFHASSPRAILPALPQTINGTANDAARVPETNPSHGSYHWTFERLISAGLVPLTIAPFAAGSLNPMTDAILCATILIHSHIGFDALIVDYLPPKRVPKIRALFNWGLRLATVVVGVGLYEFETNDVGVTAAISRIWKA